jgi:hypothetical protein
MTSVPYLFEICWARVDLPLRGLPTKASLRGMYRGAPLGLGSYRRGYAFYMIVYRTADNVKSLRYTDVETAHSPYLLI